MLTLWNALNPFSATGYRPRSNTGGGGGRGSPRPLQESVLYKMPQGRACHGIKQPYNTIRQRVYFKITQKQIWHLLKYLRSQCLKIQYYSNSKTCLKRPFKNRQQMTLMTNDSLMKVESVAEWAFCNTFDLHLTIIGIENQFLVFILDDRLRHANSNIQFEFWKKMQQIVLRIMLTLWNALNPFSSTGYHLGQIQGGGGGAGGAPLDPFKKAYSIKCLKVVPVMV